MNELHIHDFSLSQAKKDLESFLCGQSELELTIHYVSDFRSAKVLRELSDTICKHFLIDAKWTTRIILIIDELNNNAIEYGSKEGDINRFFLHISPNTPQGLNLSISVTDAGSGAKTKKASEMEEIRKNYENEDFLQHDSIRGRGLFLIISRLVDRLSFEDSKQGGLTVHIEKYLSLAG